ncbi:AMP-binding protein [Gordonia sp. 'Campus']|uniref:AMP-binding protein n=1 Tax=Gordonia sp. 'Campus' TaxID=2915824 RepID=UPI001EE4813F|nr:AMP-binding protein [Gordonia sp. 'Campus']
MSQTSASCSLLSAAHDTHGALPAVHAGDAVIDFERFYESVEWMAEQLASCGVTAGSRVGLAIRTGWEFVLAWHSLLEADAVTVPIALRPQCEPADPGDIAFVLAHVDQCVDVEDLIEATAPEHHCRQMYRVADDFVLAALGASEVLRNEGGLDADLESGSPSTAGQLIAEAEWMAEDDDGLRRGARVRLEGDLGTRETMVRILACASAGACVAVDAPFGVPDWGAPPLYDRVLEASVQRGDDPVGEVGLATTDEEVDNSVGSGIRW